MKDTAKGGISNFRKHIIEVLLFALVTVAILVVLIFQSKAKASVNVSLSVRGILFLLGCVLILWFVNAAKFGLIAYLTGYRIAREKSFEIVLASIFASNITPYYSGLVVSQVYFLSKFGGNVGISAVISSVYLTLTLIVAIMFCIIFILSPHTFVTGVRGDFYLGLISFVIFVSLFALFLMFFPDKSKKLVAMIGRLFHRNQTQQEKAMQFIDQFDYALRYFVSRNKFLLLVVIVLSFVSQFLSILLVPLSFAALGLKFNFYEVFLTQVAMQFTASVGITPGGIGIIESAFAGFFYPLAQGYTPALTLLYRIASFYFPTIVGAFFFFGLLGEQKTSN
ncbi:MAG: lysylphosphatidylglycerol synthase transmembrane domain-containing protein [Caldisericaceae bacterium]